MLPDFRARASPAELPEWMDQPCSYEDFRDCLVDLEAANRWTFAARPTLAWLAKLPRQQTPLRVLDVGFGSGGMLRVIAQWAKQRDVQVRLVGVDLNPYAERVAKELNVMREPIAFITGDAYAIAPEAEFDVVISSLMTHHLEEVEIVRFLEWMDSRAQLGWFVNDLYRAAAPYAAFWSLSRIARWHRFVQHDGPVSIRRGFRKDDWQRMCAVAGVSVAKVERWAPWRLCVGRMR